MSDEPSNPYAASSLFEPAAELPASAADSARNVFLAWERLRIIYNGVLICVTLVSLLSIHGDIDFLAFAVQGAISLNIAFCAGACAEGYVALFGFPRRAARLLIFLLGTFLATIATCYAIYSYVPFSMQAAEAD